MHQKSAALLLLCLTAAIAAPVDQVQPSPSAEEGSPVISDHPQPPSKTPDGTVGEKLPCGHEYHVAHVLTDQILIYVPKNALKETVIKINATLNELKEEYEKKKKEASERSPYDEEIIHHTVKIIPIDDQRHATQNDQEDRGKLPEPHPVHQHHSHIHDQPESRETPLKSPSQAEAEPLPTPLPDVRRSLPAGAPVVRTRRQLYPNIGDYGWNSQRYSQQPYGYSGRSNYGYDDPYSRSYDGSYARSGYDNPHDYAGNRDLREYFNGYYGGNGYQMPTFR